MAQNSKEKPKNEQISKPATRESKISKLKSIGEKIPDNISTKYLDDLFLNRIHDVDHLLDDEEVRDGKIYKKISKPIKEAEE